MWEKLKHAEKDDWIEEEADPAGRLEEALPHINRFDAFYVELDAIIALDLVQTPGKEWMHGIQT